MLSFHEFITVSTHGIENRRQPMGISLSAGLPSLPTEAGKTADSDCPSTVRNRLVALPSISGRQWITLGMMRTRGYIF